MGRKKAPVPSTHGIKLSWMGEGGMVKEEKFIPIGDNYRTMRSYTLCIRHCERQAKEVTEGIELEAWKKIKNKKK